jgi:hypothetical protein
MCVGSMLKDTQLIILRTLAEHTYVSSYLDTNKGFLPFVEVHYPPTLKIWTKKSDRPGKMFEVPVKIKFHAHYALEKQSVSIVTLSAGGLLLHILHTFGLDHLSSEECMTSQYLFPKVDRVHSDKYGDTLALLVKRAQVNLSMSLKEWPVTIHYALKTHAFYNRRSYHRD